MPKSSASVSSHPVLSDKPFIDPSARPTGPVVNLADQDLKVTKTDVKPKKKSHKSKTVKSKEVVSSSPVPASHIPGPGDDMQEPVFMPVSSVDKPVTQPVQITGQSAIGSTASQTSPDAFSTGQPQQDFVPSSGLSSTLTGSGAMTLPEQAYRDPPVQAFSDDELSDEDNSVVEEGEVSSDNLEKQEQTEDMTFRETVRSVHPGF